MTVRDFIPTKDDEFRIWTNNFMSYLMQIQGQIQFPPNTYQELSVLHTDFVNKLQIAEAESTRTKLTIEAKTEARELLESSLRAAIREYLTYNHLLTDVDRDGLGLPIHKTTHTPSPVATTYPDYEIDTSVIRRLTIHFKDQGSTKSKAKPPGQHGAEIRWAISDTPIVNVSDLKNSSFDTKTPFTLEFEGEDRGKTVYFCLCWENTRGEKGPWSEIISAIIP
ncbi:MAG: hypothetical protein LBT09_04385 [Planctomycetaceae bacterium]|jgi:hypothetical protein|nr:hypothetical protein [Planctomycetaceae bacterium]